MHRNHIAGILLLTVLACRDENPILGPKDASSPDSPVGKVLVGRAVLSTMDTYIQSNAANSNRGSNDTLRILKVGTNGANRILISMPQTRCWTPWDKTHL
jgi:hypothetical protein